MFDKNDPAPIPTIITDGIRVKAPPPKPKRPPRKHIDTKTEPRFDQTEPNYADPIGRLPKVVMIMSLIGSVCSILGFLFL